MKRRKTATRTRYETPAHSESSASSLAMSKMGGVELWETRGRLAPAALKFDRKARRYVLRDGPPVYGEVKTDAGLTSGSC